MIIIVLVVMMWRKIVSGMMMDAQGYHYADLYADGDHYEKNGVLTQPTICHTRT